MNNFRDLIYNFFYVIPKNFHNKIFYCILFSIVISIFEFISIGSLVPFIQTVLNKEIIINHSFFFFSNYLNKSNQIIIFSTLILFLFLTKGILSLIFINYILDIKRHLHYQMINNLLFSYVKKDYFFFLENNSSKLISNLDYETSLFCDRFFISFINLIKESFVIISIIFLIFIIQPIASLLSFVIVLIFSMIFIKYNRKKINFFAKNRQELQSVKIKNFQEIFFSIKEIKILNLENFFLNKSSLSVGNFLQTVKNYSFLLELPKYLFEFIGVCIIFLFIFISFNINQSIEILAIELGVLIVGAFRLIPLASKMIYLNSEIKFTYPSLLTLKKEILLKKSSTQVSEKDLKKNKIKSINQINLLNVYFEYKDKKQILNNINLEINKYDKIFVKGISGSGKSTLAEIICGILEPSKGKVLINQRPINQHLEILNCSYLPQKSVLMDDTILKNIALGSKIENINCEKINEILSLVGLSDFIKTLKNGLDTNVGELGNNLSGGQRQRISLARSVYFNPSILILDEATNALDEKSEIEIIENLFRYFKEQIIIIISHNNNAQKFCNKIFNVANNTVNTFDKK